MASKPRHPVGAACVAAVLLLAAGPAAQARIVFNEQGQIVELACNPKRIADDERVACGADAPTWASIHDAQGQLRRQVQHVGGRLIALREYSAAGVIAYDEDRRFERAGESPKQVERVRRRTYDDAGRLKLESVSVDGRAQSEREFNEDGVEIRLTRWNARDEKTETEWYPNRVVARHEWPAIYEGAPARMIQEYWDNGQIKSRGTVDARDRRLGLFQTFHRGAGVASESFYANGRLVRKLEFDSSGRLLLEEEYLADGTPRATMRR